jgi:hypothetical protein
LGRIEALSQQRFRFVGVAGSLREQCSLNQVSGLVLHPTSERSEFCIALARSRGINTSQILGLDLELGGVDHVRTCKSSRKISGHPKGQDPHADLNGSSANPAQDSFEVELVDHRTAGSQRFPFPCGQAEGAR